MAGFFSNLFNFLRDPNDGRKVDRRLDQIKAERQRLKQDEYDRRLAEVNNQDAREAREAREEKRREGDPVYRFIVLGDVQAGFSSSNVAQYWYEQANRTLYIQYKDGSTYAYYSVSEPEAISLFQSASKGTWVWDNLRIRGTKVGARKEYALSVSSTKGRRWEETSETAAEHSEEVAWQSGASSPYQKLGKFSRAKPLTNKGRRKR